jgi:16S rRNA (guanine527-N7)-methyltransferase
MTDLSSARSIQAESGEDTTRETSSLEDAAFQSIAPERRPLLRELVEEVLRVNQQFNLTAVRDPQEAWIKHILDSLQGLKSTCFEGELRVIDVGAGAGFPGLALAAARPNLHVTLMDSTRKKCDFMQATAQKLGLNTQVLCERAKPPGTTRSSANTSILPQRALSFTERGLRVDVAAGEKNTTPCTVARSECASRVAGCKTGHWTSGGQTSTRADAFLSYSLPGHDMMYHIVVIDKVKATPPQFPRRVGLPKQKPL